MKIDVYNPNDPKVYTDPELVMLLDPAGQLIALLNLARSGQIVRGDEVMTLEAILRNAGYDVDVDGHFTRAEMAALEHLREKMNDTAFKEAGKTWAEILLGAECAQKIKDLLTPDHLQPGPATPARQAFARVMHNLFDPE